MEIPLIKWIISLNGIPPQSVPPNDYLLTILLPIGIHFVLLNFTGHVIRGFELALNRLSHRLSFVYMVRLSLVLFG